MPRRLPWDTKRKDSSDARQREKAHSLPNHRRGPSTSDLDRNAPATMQEPRPQSTEQHAEERNSIFREKSMSSSPPPAPPQIEFMREDGTDDAWIMVEDEFMSTAHEFTRHLHHTAYKERKLEAIKRLRTSKNEQARLIASTENLAQRRTAEGAALLEGANIEDAEEADILTFADRRLARLMLGHSNSGNSRTRLDQLEPHCDSKSKSQAAEACGRPTLSSAAKVLPHRLPEETHAASCLGIQHEIDTQDLTDVDDLDAISNIPSSPPIAEHNGPSEAQLAASKAGLGLSMLGKPVKRPQDGAVKDMEPAPSSPKDDGGFPTRRRIGSSLAEWRTRRAKRRKQEEENEQGREEIPMFLV